MRKLLSILVIPFLIVGAFFYYRLALQRPGPGKNVVMEVVIEPGESVSQIADSLYQEGVINSAALFKIYALLSQASSNLQAGRYYLPGNLALTEVVNRLQYGILDVNVTFLEGWRREEMAEALDAQEGLKISGQDFLLASVGMDGHLFPDTYAISPSMTAQNLVDTMLDNFDKYFSAEMASAVFSQGLALSEAVNLASIVEREAASAESRKIVAGILIKRYQSDWALQADATSQYSLGVSGDWWPKKLGQEDLDSPSSYNTRNRVGLPPTPICNPGLESLEAVAYPSPTDYWFYLTDSKGGMHYAQTAEEHAENVGKYLF